MTPPHRAAPSGPNGPGRRPAQPPAGAARRGGPWALLAGAAVVAAAAAGATAWTLAVPAVQGAARQAEASLHAALDVLRLSEAMSRFAAATPDLEDAPNGLRRQTLYIGLRQHAEQVATLRAALTGTGPLADARGEPLRRLLVGLDTHLDDLNHMVERRIALDAELRDALKRVPQHHASFRAALGTVRDDAMIALRAVSAGGTPDAATTLLQIRDGLHGLGRDLADQLVAAGMEDRESRLATAQAAFRETAGRIEDLLDRLPIGLASARRADAARRLMALGIDTNNVFDLRRDLLRIRETIAEVTRHGRDRAAEAARAAEALAQSLREEAEQSHRNAAVALDLMVPATALAAALAAAGAGRWTAAPPAVPPGVDVQPAAAGADATVPPLAVLLADDEPVNQMVGAAMLRRTGHVVTVVGDGRQAVEAVRGQRFDLVLMDLRMPEMDGLDAIKRIRALPDPVSAQVRIIVLTASIVPEDTERCHAAGADAVLPKPLQVDALAPVLGNLFGVAPAPVPVAPPAPHGAPQVDGAGGGGGEEPVLDGEAIARMHDALPADRVAALVSGTVTTLRDYHAALGRAWLAGDRAATGAMAHKIAGVAGVYGCRRLSHAAQALELSLERGEAAPDALVAAVDGAVDPALRALLDRRPAPCAAGGTTGR